MASTVALTMLAQRSSYAEAAGEQSTQQMDAHSETSDRTPPAQQKGSKSKRVRTGCLTCRDRHLKCDEGTPVCLNCLKSNRNCQRGLRINWQDTPSKHVPFLLSQSNDWSVTFQDESREIASEYQGGLEQYGPPKRSRTSEPPGYRNHRTHHHRPSYPDVAYLNLNNQHELHQPSPQDSMGMQVPEPQGADYLTDQKKVLYMQVFVEEIGIWMDSMDSMKHVSWDDAEKRLVDTDYDSSLDFCPFTHFESLCCSMHACRVVPGISHWSTPDTVTKRRSATTKRPPGTC